MKRTALWSERMGDELYVYFGDKLIYKKWYIPGTNVKMSSKLFPKTGLPNQL